MAAKIRGLPTGQFHGDNELPLALGLIYTYVADGAYTTNKATYTTSAADTAHPNPIVLDEEGRAIIWWDGVYDVIIKDAAGNTIDTIPNYGANESSAVSDVGQILNPSFEFGSSTPDDWTLTSDGAQTPATETTDVDHGAQALKFTSVGSGGGTATSVFFECYPTEDILVDFRLKSSVVDVRNLVEVLWFDKAQSSVSNSTVYDESAANPTAWATKFGVVTAPSTAVYAKIKIHGCHNSDATAGNSILDGIHHASLAPSTNQPKGDDIVAAAALPVDVPGTMHDVTGATAITSLNTVGVGTLKVLQFDAGPVVTHHATNLILPGGKNITVEAGAVMVLYEYAAADWLVVNYQRNEYPLSNDHDHGYDASLTAWAVATDYIIGDIVQSTSPDGIFYFKCATAGTSHASTEPVWPTRDGDTIAEATGTVVWTAADGSGAPIPIDGLDSVIKPWVELGSDSITSSAASSEFLDIDVTNYDEFKYIWWDVRPTTASSTIRFSLGYGGGTTTWHGSTLYQFAVSALSSGGTAANTNSTGASSYEIATSTGTASTDTCAGELSFTSNSGSRYPCMFSSGISTNGTTSYRHSGACEVGSAPQITAISMFFLSANVEYGEFRLMGRRK